jgi:hypothetical protein
MGYRERSLTAERFLTGPDGFLRYRLRILSCDLCGALVGDRELHDQWHTNQARVAADAGYAANFNRPLR